MMITFRDDKNTHELSNLQNSFDIGSDNEFEKDDHDFNFPSSLK